MAGAEDRPAYDDAFRITGITDTVTPANSYGYGYDALDRLTSAATSSTTRGWTYDANGNRLSETGASPSTYTISATNNRVASIAGAVARTYGYDAAGNTLTHTNTTATYNNRGRMKSFKVGTTTANFIYNALGQLARRTGGTPGTRLYMYDEAGHLLGEYNSTGGLVQETVWLGDTPVATLRPGTPAAIFYVHTDHLNTPRKVTRPSDNKARWTWESDPFGTALPNENPQALGAFKYNLRFPGQLYDAHTGLNYNYYRDYDAVTGRYIQSDPIGLGGGINTYSYVAGNPLAYLDPYGLFGLRDAAGFVPVVGSGLDAYDAYTCGRYGLAALNAALAVVDATGVGALAKGLAVGTMRWGSRRAIREIHANTRSWDEMRRGLQDVGEVARNSAATARRDWLTTDHVFIKQRSGLPHGISNHPANLQTGVSQSLNSQFENMNWLQRASYLPAWMKAAAAGAASYTTGLFVDSGCGCETE